jgi:hypothetical protein
MVSIKFEANKDAPSLLPLEPTKSKIVRSSSAVRLINFENGDRLLMMEEMSACSRQSRREKFSVSLRAAESAGDADADASGAGTVTVCRAKFEFFDVKKFKKNKFSEPEQNEWILMYCREIQGAHLCVRFNDSQISCKQKPTYRINFKIVALGIGNRK